ncbi:MAG: hypothetical protein CVV02_12830 [Firmicutes bacterium HGW-Firmicutes-7]|nr:MAG: hypothetical protein CVV02_12830 [Firmicutes bacterium HGW-Firmicutes-7]
MGAKDKREKERLEAIHNRKSDVINAAKVIFAEKSIEKTTMQDIALRAEVGVASVYRYYTTKMELVMEVAKDYWENELSYDHSLLFGTGIEQTLQIMNYLSLKFSENPSMLVFMDQLDSFVMSWKDQYPMDEYSKMVTNNLPILTGIIEKGKLDGTIRKDICAQEAGGTCLDLFIALAQKLILREKVLKSSCQINVLTALAVYKEMIIKYLETAS